MAILSLLRAAVLALATLSAHAIPPAIAPGAKPASLSTADHSKFKVLQQSFASGPDVTAACLTCHNDAARQVQKTKHWTWESVDPKTGQKRGKKNIINNFCTTPISNEKDCTACHAGYGWKDGNFDFTVENNVDCLVCHDTTGTYRKLPGDAGHPVYKSREFPPGSGRIVEAVDLLRVAQNVGKSSRSNCGSCHFFGAGANGAKHGDLDASLQHPGRYLDVHMDEKGLNFTCVTCHATRGHEVSGSRYNLSAADKGPAHIRGKADAAPTSCQACHGNKPHPDARLNAHTDKLACQTCHIPEFARNQIGTERSWDWSQATVMGADGKPVVRKDSGGRRAFDSKKGAWVWESYVIPEYRWFNGVTTFKVLGDKIDPTRVVEINSMGGAPNAPDSRVWPMNVHTGKQVYDPVNKTLVVAHTAGEDDTALWHNFDWPKAIGTGMKAANLPWSGKYGFVATEMSWPITHMVAPKEDALACKQCHTAPGRLDQVPGLYIPGRHGNPLLDTLGWSFAGLAFLGVVAHGAGRVYTSRKGVEK